MAKIELALPRLLRNEGGYSNDPADSGGETYRGITRKNYPKWAGWEIVDRYKPLRDEQIIDNLALQNMVSVFYEKNFWDDNKLGEIEDQEIATKLLDMAVNLGSNRAIKILQEQLNILYNTELKVDGRVGQFTLNAINAAQPEELLDHLRLALVAFYTRLVVKRPKNKKFLNGWLRRANQ